MTALLLAWLGCSPEPGPTEVHVFAASSLTEAFQELEASFERQHPEVDVVLTFAGSQVLRLQIEQGASAHVFASAHEDHAAALVAAGDLSPVVPFATNRLVVVAAPDNPAGLRGFADLPAARRLVIGTESVPLGRYTRQMLDRAEPGFAAAVRSHVVSTETNARLVRAKVELGEADAAIVYRSDAAPLPPARVWPVPEELDVPARYVIGTHPASPAAASAFVRHVLEPAGQATLAAHGFRPPEAP